MAPKLPIYMDNAATTPVDPRVVETMLPYFTERFGNAASRNHHFGWVAEEAVDYAREQVAQVIGARSEKEIVFTSGATESDNLAIKGIANFYKSKGNHIITCKAEHKAVLDTCKRLERSGFDVTYLSPQQDGRVTPEQVKEALTDKTILVSLMLVNNEIGSQNPIREIGEVTRAAGVLLHCDATQGIGKVDFDAQRDNVDLASLSAHKMYGPKGVGALYVSRSKPRVRIVAEMDGGGHERGMRSGTLNVPGIVGFGRAAELARQEWKQDTERLEALRARLHGRITDALEEVHLNGAEAPHRAPGILNLSFAFVEGAALMMAIKDVAVSSGSACTSASLEPSYVLRALGVDEELAHSSIRFGLGKFNTEEEVDYVAALVIEQVERLRAMSPLYEMHKEGIDLSTIEWTAH